MSDDMNKMLNVGGNEFSLATLAGMSAADVEEVRFVLIPLGVYDFKINKAEFVTKPISGDDKPGVQIECEIIDVQNMVGEEAKEKTVADFVGKTIRHEILLFDDKVMEMLGRVKAFCVDVGLGEGFSGDFEQMLTEVQTCQFRAKITHQVDKNDKDKKYPRLDVSTLMPLELAQAAA